MASFDIFNNRAFSMSGLTNAIETVPHAPRMLGELKLFREVPIRTTVAWIEKKQGRLRVISTANRGTMKDVRSARPRTAIPFGVPHVPYFQDILADDIQNIRAFGSETELQAMGSYINEQLEGMRDDHEVTWEWHRVGALKGLILDADNSTVLYNLFTVFGLTQVVIPWYSTDAAYSSTLTTITRTIADKLGNETFSGVIAICGNAYFDAIVNHASIASAYDRWRDGQFFREQKLGPQWYGAAQNGFMFQNIMFINYRGTIGDVDFIPDNEAYFVPNGVRNLFQEVVAPGDFMETVNTRGRRLYAKQERMNYDKGVQLHTQSNCLAMCTRPDAIIKSTWAATNPSSSSA